MRVAIHETGQNRRFAEILNPGVRVSPNHLIRCADIRDPVTLHHDAAPYNRFGRDWQNMIGDQYLHEMQRRRNRLLASLLYFSVVI